MTSVPDTPKSHGPTYFGGIRMLLAGGAGELDTHVGWDEIAAGCECRNVYIAYGSTSLSFGWLDQSKQNGWEGQQKKKDQPEEFKYELSVTFFFSKKGFES